MTRHWFAIASSLAFGASFVTSTSAQVSPNYTGTELRPGWSREGIDPAAARGRYPVAPAPTQLAQASGNEGRSFLPNWFGWGNGGSKNNQQNNSQQPNSMKSSSNQSRPMNGASGTTNHVGSTAKSENAPPDPATMQDDTLPGLGGAPLPRKNGQPSNSTSTSKSSGETSLGLQPRTTQSKTQSSGTTNPAGTRSAARQPLTSPSGTSPTGASSSATRNSPGRRTAPHISPDELRRELSGAFPTPTTRNDETPRMAQADQQADAIDTDVLPPTEADPAAEDDEAIVTDTPLTLPTTSTQEEVAAPAINAPIPENPQAAEPSVKASSSPAAADAFGASQRSRSAYGTNNTVRLPFSSPNSHKNSNAGTATPAAPQASRGKEAFGDALQVASGGDPSVLSSSQTPVLVADIRGPKQIQVGREALYRVRLQNQSDIPAEGIIATVRIPSGAEVMNTTATQGSVQPSQEPQSNGGLQWHIARLDHRAGETLEIRIVPRESRPLELGISWTVAPVGSRAVVEVQEAKLQIEIAGPNEVLFNKPQVFKITLSNPGTGPAENVKIELMPPGGGQDVTSHTLGDLAAGATQTVEVELTAREAGKMFVKAVAAAEGGLTSEVSKEIFCRKPELEVDYRGPGTKYAGTLATYFIRVRNPGTAPADDVTVRASIPEGAEFTSASDGQSYDAQTGEVTWRVGTLAPGDDNYMELKCVLKSPGANRVKMTAATASGDLTDSKTAETNVVAIADLKLEVTDPSGPIAVGTHAVYEIHIHNRGASAAKDVNVVALFSDGIEPEQAEGAMYSVTDGRVSFRTIDELQAGRDIVLRIRAHAVQPGTHVFRAEVLCKELEIKLAAEETTRFYADDVRSDGDQLPGKAASRSEAFQPAVK
jgi:uncharacterized repeat protein (TIGR01451 family)